MVFPEVGLPDLVAPYVSAGDTPPLYGVILAGGKSTRMGGIPKFFLPDGRSYLLLSLYRDMVEAGADKVYVLTSPLWKAPIEEILLPAAPKAIVRAVEPYGALTDLWSFLWRGAVSHGNVLLGMADTHISNPTDYRALARSVRSVGSKPHLSVAVFDKPSEVAHKYGVVYAKGNKLHKVVDKPPKGSITDIVSKIWGALSWNKEFSDLIRRTNFNATDSLSSILDVAIKNEASTYVHHSKGYYWDCGTFESYVGMLNDEVE